MKRFNIDVDSILQVPYPLILCSWREKFMMVGGKTPTILDVARVAGVSVGSVSNVINRTRPVSDDLQQRVITAANALGYQINSVAQTLRRRSSKTIGLCTTHVTTVYLRDLTNALDEIATQNGYELIQVLTHQEPDRELHRVRSLIGRQVDGLILLPSLQPQATLDAISHSRTPTVIVDRLCDDGRFDYVIVDNRHAMRDVVRNLVDLGHRRVLFIAQNLAVITTRHRLAGLEDEVEAAGGALSFETMERGDDETAFTERLRQALLPTPGHTAIIMGNSSVALSTIQALQVIGIHCPQEIALVTFDNPEWASVLSPPLSTVKSPTREIAEAVWAALQAQLVGQSAMRRSVFVRSELILRKSSMSPPRTPH